MHGPKSVKRQKWLGESATILHMHWLSCRISFRFIFTLQSADVITNCTKTACCKNSKSLSKVQRKFWDRPEQYRTEQNSLRRVLVQSLDSKLNGNILYFLYMKHANKKNFHTTASLGLSLGSVSTVNRLQIVPNVDLCFPRRLEESGAITASCSTRAGEWWASSSW